MHAVGNDRITVIGTPLDQVQLIATARSHFMSPQPALSIERHSKYVAVAQRPDLHRHLTLIGERVILRHAAIGVQPDHLAQIAGHVLRRVELLALAGADPEHAVVIERNTEAEMAIA